MSDERQWRKQRPVFSGVLNYFPDALLEVAYCSYVGNEQHNPGEPLHWAKEKSTDEPDALVRHLVKAGTVDSDGVRHSAKVAWRSLAMLQREIEAEQQEPKTEANWWDTCKVGDITPNPTHRYEAEPGAGVCDRFWSRCVRAPKHTGQHVETSQPPSKDYHVVFVWAEQPETEGESIETSETLYFTGTQYYRNGKVACNHRSGDKFDYNYWCTLKKGHRGKHHATDAGPDEKWSD